MPGEIPGGTLLAVENSVFFGVTAANFLCIAALVVLVIAVVDFRFDVGLVSFALSLVLILCGVVNEKAANELSDTITEFVLDEETGEFASIGRSIKSESPVCIIFG